MFRTDNEIWLQVGVTSGAIRNTGVALDREAKDSYTLLLQARSGARSEDESGRVAHTRLHVSVTDVNDNCPVFVERPYVAAVLAGAEPGAPVIRVRAVDADANDNGEVGPEAESIGPPRDGEVNRKSRRTVPQVRYEMKRGHGELFRVDRRSGQISLKQTLDAHNQLYTLVIAAFDGGRWRAARALARVRPRTLSRSLRRRAGVRRRGGGGGTRVGRRRRAALAARALRARGARGRTRGRAARRAAAGVLAAAAPTHLHAGGRRLARRGPLRDPLRRRYVPRRPPWPFSEGKVDAFANRTFFIIKSMSNET